MDTYMYMYNLNASTGGSKQRNALFRGDSSSE